MKKYNYIGATENWFDAYWIVHGNPSGWQANGSDYTSYVNFHDGRKPAQYGIPWPVEPGEKFIHEEVPDHPGCFAYTFMRTGIYEMYGERPGTNYGAITVIMDKIDEKNLEKFKQDLEKWFTENILNKFTYRHSGPGWLKWNSDATRLFNGDYNEQLKDSLQLVLEPYFLNQRTNSNQKGSNRDKTDKFNEAAQKLREEIARLEQEKKNIEKQLAEKYAQLENM